MQLSPVKLQNHRTNVFLSKLLNFLVVCHTVIDRMEIVKRHRMLPNKNLKCVALVWEVDNSKELGRPEVTDDRS